MRIKRRANLVLGKQRKRVVVIAVGNFAVGCGWAVEGKVRIEKKSLR